MPLRIETFSNVSGGNAFFKALTHPLAARKKLKAFSRRCAPMDPWRFYDPPQHGGYGRPGLMILKSLPARRPITFRTWSSAAAANLRKPRGEACDGATRFTGDRAIRPRLSTDPVLADQIKHLMTPRNERPQPLMALRLPDAMISDRAALSFTAQFSQRIFVFFRDGEGHHTRLVTANYWGGIWRKGCALLVPPFTMGNGVSLAEWEDKARTRAKYIHSRQQGNQGAPSIFLNLRASSSFTAGRHPRAMTL